MYKKILGIVAIFFVLGCGKDERVGTYCDSNSDNPGCPKGQICVPKAACPTTGECAGQCYFPCDEKGKCKENKKCVTNAYKKEIKYCHPEEEAAPEPEEPAKDEKDASTAETL
jgi:hypothetical protein